MKSLTILAICVFIFIIGIWYLSNDNNPNNQQNRPERRLIRPIRSIHSNNRTLSNNDESIQTYNRFARGETEHINLDLSNPHLSRIENPTCRPVVNLDPDWRILDDHDDEEISENESNSHYVCKVCMTNKVNTVFMPCFHAAVCSSCANRLQNSRRCPICRSSIDTARRIYL